MWKWEDDQRPMLSVADEGSPLCTNKYLRVTDLVIDAI